MENDKPNNEKLVCMNCRRELRVGDDALTVEKQVVGLRGLVSLDAHFRFCGDTCLVEYFDDEIEKVERKRRIA